MTIKEEIKTERAAPPAAFYSQGIRSQGFVYTAGCVGVDPATGRLVEGGFEQQTRVTLENVRAILQASGTNMDLVVKTTCFIKNMTHFQLFDRIYREFFSAPPPVRTTIVCDLVRADFLVEVEAVAVLPDTSREGGE